MEKVSESYGIRFLHKDRFGDMLFSYETGGYYHGYESNPEEHLSKFTADMIVFFEAAKNINPEMSSK